MNKRFTLWQKLKIKYHYHWLDKEYTPSPHCSAVPTWYMTHSREQINKRQAKFNAKLDKSEQKFAETLHLLKRLSEEYQKG